MGSFQQILIGIVCLIAAFLFGRYVSTHPNPDQLNHAFSDLLTTGQETENLDMDDPGPQEERPATMETMRNKLATRLPMLKAPASQQGEDRLPPPSELGPPSSTFTKKSSSMPNAVDLESTREIVVPDFSVLAAEFKNTPLELPPIQDAATGAMGQDTETPNVQERVIVSQSSEEANGRDQIANVETNKSNEDFTNGDDNRLLKIAPPPLQQTESPPIASVTEALPPNAVRSFQAQQPFQSGVSNDRPTGASVGNETADPNRNLVAKTVLEDPPEPDRFLDPVNSQPIPNASTTPSGKPRIPFGLTEDAKTELVKIRRPNNSGISLGTTKFKSYRALQGDTLQKISTRFYGKPDFYLDIYLANQRQLRSPAEVPAGLMLQIPVYE